MLLAVGVALLWRGDDRGVDDLAAHRQKPSRREGPIKALKQDLDRRFPRDPGARQRLAEDPDRVGVRHRIGHPQTEKAHERQPVADQIFGPLVRQIVAGLQDQRFEHQHVVEGRAAAFRAVRAQHRALQIRPEQREIHHPIQPFQAVALGRKLLQSLVNVEKSCLPPHSAPQCDPAHRITNPPKPPGYWRSPVSPQSEMATAGIAAGRCHQPSGRLHMAASSAGLRGRAGPRVGPSRDGNSRRASCRNSSIGRRVAQYPVL